MNETQRATRAMAPSNYRKPSESELGMVGFAEKTIPPFPHDKLEFSEPYGSE